MTEHLKYAATDANDCSLNFSVTHGGAYVDMSIGNTNVGFTMKGDEIDQLIDVLDVSAGRRPRNSRWIKASQCEPDVGDHCTFVIELKNDNRYYFAGFMRDDGSLVDDFGDDYGYDLGDVIYWMPLLEAPEE